MRAACSAISRTTGSAPSAVKNGQSRNTASTPRNAARTLSGAVRSPRASSDPGGPPDRISAPTGTVRPGRAACHQMQRGDPQRWAAQGWAGHAERERGEQPEDGEHGAGTGQGQRREQPPGVPTGPEPKRGKEKHARGTGDQPVPDGETG